MSLTIRALIAVVATAGVVGLVGAYLGAAALQDDSPDEPVVESTKVAGPDEPVVQSTKGPYPGEPLNSPGVQNDPGGGHLPPGITRGVEVTPRPCPECFPVPMLEPSPLPTAQCPAEKPSPRYSDLALADSGDWLRYDSPHHPLSLSYPPDWILEPSYQDVWRFPDVPGPILGPVLESVTIYNGLWFDALGGDPNTALPPGAAKIELSYNPWILRMGGCEGADFVKVEELPVSVGGKPAQVRLVVGEWAHQVTYSITTGFVAAEDGFVTFAGLTNDPSLLGLIRTVLESMAFE